MGNGIQGARKQFGSQSRGEGGDAASEQRAFSNRPLPVGVGRAKGTGIWLVKASGPITIATTTREVSPQLTPAVKQPDVPGSARSGPENRDLPITSEVAPADASAQTAPSEATASPAPAPKPPISKFERFKAAVWNLGKEATALDVEVGAKLLRATGLVSAQRADEVVEHAYGELGVNKETSVVRGMAVAARDGLEALPGEVRDGFVNLGGAVVEGGAKVLEAAGVVDQKKTEAFIDERYAAHGLKRENNGVRNAVVGAAHHVAHKAKEAALVDVELQIRAGVAAHIIDPAAGKKAIDAAYQAAELTPKDNEVREFGKQVVQFAVDVEKIKTGTEAGAAILLVRDLRAKGKISPSTAASWEKKISAFAKLDPEQAVAIAKKSRRTAADAVVFATGVGLEVLSPITDRLGQTEAERTEFFDLLQKDLGGSKSRLNEVTDFAEDKALPALEFVGYAAIDTALRGLKVPPPVAAAIAGGLVQAANSLGNNESWGDTLWDVSVAAGEYALASVAVGKFESALRASVLAKTLQALPAPMLAAYRSGDKAVKDMVDRGVQQATQSFTTSVLNKVVDQSTRLPIRLTEKLIENAHIGPNGKVTIDPKWKEQAIREFGQASVNVAIGQLIHLAAKGLPLEKIKGSLVSEQRGSPRPGDEGASALNPESAVTVELKQDELQRWGDLASGGKVRHIAFDPELTEAHDIALSETGGELDRYRHVLGTKVEIPKLEIVSGDGFRPQPVNPDIVGGDGLDPKVMTLVHRDVSDDVAGLRSHAYATPEMLSWEAFQSSTESVPLHEVQNTLAASENARAAVRNKTWKYETEGYNYYVPREEFPLKDALPPPPAAGSPEAAADLDAVRDAAVNARTPERVALVKADARINALRFADVLGDKFTPEAAPRMIAVLHQAFADGYNAGEDMKHFYARPRPYLVDPKIETIVPPIPTGSYPSNHSMFGYLTARLLGRAVPELKDRLMARAAQYAGNRVVGGVHFPTDIEGGRLAAQQIEATLLDDPAFRADFSRATTELRAALGLPANPVK